MVAIGLDVDVRLAVAIMLLAAVAVTAATVTRLGQGPAIARAAARATVQLAAVSALVSAIVKQLGWTLLFLGVMLAVASATAGRRVSDGRRRWLAAVPIAAGVVPTVSLLLLGGVVPPKGIVLVPVAGILIGGAMTATSLSGRRALDELAARRGEEEAALAIGLSDRDARLEVCRPSAALALVPVIDQTRTVGLVTLPGAFVGMLLGGATPAQAGAVQLFVLVALLEVQVVAVAVTVELVARGVLQRGRPARR